MFEKPTMYLLLWIQAHLAALGYQALHLSQIPKNEGWSLDLSTKDITGVTVWKVYLMHSWITLSMLYTRTGTCQDK